MAYLSTGLVLLGLFSFLLFTPVSVEGQAAPVAPSVPIADDDPVIVDPTMTSFVRGDLTGDLQLDLADAIASLASLFQGEVIRCQDAHDCNDDGQLDVSDPISLLSFLFGGGDSLPAPGVAGCGTDETADNLSCKKSTCP